MHLSRQICLAIVLAVTVGCGAATEPSPRLTSRLFELESIQDRSLPTIVSAGAGDTTQALWSTITLGETGQALAIDHISHVYLQYPAEENTLVRESEYRIKGDSIEIGSFTPCPPGAMCVGNIRGTLVDSTLTIAKWYDPYPTNPILYKYRLVQAY